MKQNIMNSQHARWVEFCERMYDATELILGPNLCEEHFREAIENNKPLSFDCECDGSFAKTKKVLNDINRTLSPAKKLNVAKTLEFFRQHSEYCDCEVMLNICMKTNDSELFSALIGDKTCSCGNCSGKAEFFAHRKLDMRKQSAA